MFHQHLPPLYYQKLSNFSISSATCFPYILFVHSVITNPPLPHTHTRHTKLKLCFDWLQLLSYSI